MAERATVRAFLALPADPAWTESAVRFVDEVRPVSPPAAWTRPSAWHLTLKFLGDPAREALTSFSRTIDSTAAALPPFELGVDGPAIFPDHGPAGVLGVAFRENTAASSLSALSALVGRAEAEARRLGFAREDRPFHPHVTFARIRARWPADAVARFREKASRWPFPVWRADSCVLFESRLGASGATHTPLFVSTFRRGPNAAAAEPDAPVTPMESAP